MKKVCLFLLVNVLICSSGWAADGGQIFKSLRCSGCHSISSSSGMVPSLEVIADSLRGREKSTAEFPARKGTGTGRS